ncbi:MAG: ABC transporter permease [Clostridia bacterium]|jgi:ribose/xylose/arabinose/galactoside ABC-type transport system permease subunit|nr:ABC transporter permease [Clostridia bacterium]MBT7122919.1 ABC transporter permease [Clostridia bacterium]
MSKDVLRMNEKRTFKNVILDMGTTLSLLIALILLGIVWSSMTEFFLTGQNIMNLLMFASVMAIRASGLTVAMISGGLDLSQNATGALTAIVCALALEAGAPWVVILFMVIGLGLVLGGVNASLVTFAKIPAFITTLATMLIFRGVAWLLSPKTIMIMNKNLTNIGRGRIGEGEWAFPYIAIIAIVILGLTYFILNFTAFGRKVYMVGGNKEASYLSGISSNKVTFIAFVFSGLMGAIAGSLLSFQVGAALPQASQGTEMIPIAAVILGGVGLSGGKGKVSGTILAVLIMLVIRNGLQLQSIPSKVEWVVTGCVLLVAVFIDVIRSGELRKK